MSSHIHHFYQGFHIVFVGTHYRVLHDTVPEMTDPHLRHYNFNSAKAYARAVLLYFTEPLPEPANTQRLEPFYRSGFRDDGPLPSFFKINAPVHNEGCAHVFCSNTPNGGHGFRYCGRPPLPGSTRCQAHSNIPTPYQPERHFEVDLDPNNLPVPKAAR